MQFWALFRLAHSDLRTDWYSLSGYANRGNFSETSWFSIATQWILVGSHIWDREVKERLELHNLHSDYIMIRSELKYLIGGKVVMLKCWVLCGNPLQQLGSGLEPDPEPNREFGTVANTNFSAECYTGKVVWISQRWQGTLFILCNAYQSCCSLIIKGQTFPSIVTHLWRVFPFRLDSGNSTLTLSVSNLHIISMAIEINFLLAPIWTTTSIASILKSQTHYLNMNPTALMR